MLVRLICIMNHFKWAWLCFLGKQEKSWMRPRDYLHPRFSILKQPFSLLAKLVYNGSNILSSEECFQRSAIFKTMIFTVPHKVTFSRPLLCRTDFELQPLYYSSKTCALFWLVQRPAGAYHIWKMRAIYHRFDDTFHWKRGWLMVYLIGNEAAWEIDHRSTSFPRGASVSYYSRVN